MANVRGRVLVVEDEPIVNANISEGLRQEGCSVESVSRFEEFVNAAEANQYDAAFLDWELHHIYRGPDMLKLLRQRTPLTARVIVSKHDKETADALTYGADLLIRKSLPDNEKRLLEREAVRLGIVLQVSGTLAHAGVEVGVFPRKIPVGDEVERSCQSKASAVCDDWIREGRDVSPLLETLHRYGWRRAFDLAAYMRAHWYEKLGSLMDLAGWSADDLASICGAPPELAARALKGDIRLAAGPVEMMRAFDAVLSILACVLEFSDYDPPAVRIHLYSPDFLARKIEPPPWSAIGLGPFLMEAKLRGVAEAISWIRGNR